MWLIQSSGFNSSSTSISTDDACRSLQYAFWAAFCWACFRMWCVAMPYIYELKSENDRKAKLLQIQADSGTYTLQIIASCLGGCIFAISFCLLGLWYRILSLSLESQISQISSISSKTLRVVSKCYHHMTLVTRMTQASAILTPTAHIRPSSV